MSVVVIGLNHRIAPLELLERTTRRRRMRFPRRSTTSCSRPNITEAVLLSTCNRTEVYAVAERFHGAYSDIRDFLVRATPASLPRSCTDHLYSHYDEGAVDHLFAVAAGLDSAVLGETEILGQVRDAWEVAQGEGTARSTLNLLFRHAVEVGKRARTETGHRAGHRFGVDRRRSRWRRARSAASPVARVLVLGAGEHGRGHGRRTGGGRRGRGARREPHLRPCRRPAPAARRPSCPVARARRRARPRSTCC